MESFSSFLTEPSWKAVLEAEFSKPYFQKLEAEMTLRKSEGRVIYPSEGDIFSAFNLTPFKKVRVVILGQDPYHGAGQAMGLSFSVPAGVKIPPSLRNMVKEIEDDIGPREMLSGDLTPWAKQGVLLLNTVLTVEAKKAHAHAKLGWETFTNRAISTLSENRTGVVFLLWGAHAQKKSALVNEGRHKVLQAPHPSPLSAYKGFFGCRHFSKTNAYLSETQQDRIVW